MRTKTFIKCLSNDMCFEIMLQCLQNGYVDQRHYSQEKTKVSRAFSRLFKLGFLNLKMIDGKRKRYCMNQEYKNLFEQLIRIEE